MRFLCFCLDELLPALALNAEVDGGLKVRSSIQWVVLVNNRTQTEGNTYSGMVYYRITEGRICQCRQIRPSVILSSVSHAALTGINIVPIQGEQQR